MPEDRPVTIHHANGGTEQGTARGNRITTESGEYSYPPPWRDAGFRVSSGRSNGCFFGEPVSTLGQGRQFTEHGLEPVRVYRQPGGPVVTEDSYDAGPPERRGWDTVGEELKARAEGQGARGECGSGSSGSSKGGAFPGPRGCTRTFNKKETC